MAATKLLLRELKESFRNKKLQRGILTGHFNRGYCSICQCKTLFVQRGKWLRDDYLCIQCGSIPRWRALILVLSQVLPNWRELKIHESSPGGAASAKISNECACYVPTFFFHDARLGSESNGFRCENLEAQTFADESFDAVISQDVLEHVLNPDRAFREIARTLKPGGMHIFTVPWFRNKATITRAKPCPTGIEYILEPEFHCDPINPEGTLVVTEWGDSLFEDIWKSSKMKSELYLIEDKKLGLAGEFLEVFVSKK